MNLSKLTCNKKILNNLTLLKRCLNLAKTSLSLSLFIYMSNDYYSHANTLYTHTSVYV